MHVAIYDSKTGVVETLVALESLEGFDPGPGLSAADITGTSVGVGWKKSGSEFIGERLFGEVTLEGAKIDGAKKVDADAETARRKYLTDGMGQAVTYQAKAEEIRRYDVDTNPVKADYPFLSAEIGVTGASLSAVAEAVRGAVAAWSTHGPEIERVRLKAKADIAKATSPAIIQDIVSAIEWP